jgi:hypothetical protein
VQSGKPLPIYFRVHTVPVKKKKQKPETNNFPSLPRWAKHALVLDCETSTDVSHNLLFEFARFCEVTASGKYECRDEVLFYPDDLADADPDGFNQLKIYVASEIRRASGKRIRLLNPSEFVEQYFWKTLLEIEGTVLCYNAPFDLSRVAIDCRSARKKDEGWSFILSEDMDPRTGLKRENVFRPRLKIIPKDSHSAFIKLAGVGIKSKYSGKRLKSYNPGRFLDLKTTIWALRSKSLKLKDSCELFQVEKKWDYEPTGKISREELDYCRQDVRSTTALLNAVREEFDLHPIDLRPEQAYSPASIAKAYLRAMNISLPMKKFALPHRVHGIAMQSYYAPRTAAIISSSRCRTGSLSLLTWKSPRCIRRMDMLFRSGLRSRVSLVQKGPCKLRCKPVPRSSAATEEHCSAPGVEHRSNRAS